MPISSNNYQQILGKAITVIDGARGSANAEVKEQFQKLKEEFSKVAAAGEQLEREGKVLKIGVVGQVKAGKSSFLNSLFFDGENVLPRASTPMTAGLTVLEYGETNEFITEYYNIEEWGFFEEKAKLFHQIVNDFRASKKEYASLSDEEVAKIANIPDEISGAYELVSNCTGNVRRKVQVDSLIESQPFNGIKDLQNVLENYVGANGQYTSIVKCLTIRMKDERLHDLRIVDTPGVNDPIVSREQRTREFLRGCHGVFLLSFASRFFDSTDVDFLVNRIGSQGISKVVLIASKFDSALQDQGKKFKDNLGMCISATVESLEKQFNRNMASSGYTGETPIFAQSSGIGFSIAQKSPSEWDETEQQVVKQMRRFFPSDFETDEMTKDTFMELSQIDCIRQDYLDGVFMQNRSEIIARKISEYFAHVGGELTAPLNDGLQLFSDKVKMLESTDISQINAIKTSTLNFISSFTKDFDSISKRCTEMAEQSLKECWNSFQTPSNRVPTMVTNVDTTREGTWIGWDHDVSCTCRQIDSNRLVDDVARQVKDSADSIVRIWQRKLNDLTNNLIKKTIANRIAEAERNDTEGVFQADELRRVLSETIASMDNSSTVNVRDAVDKAIGRVETIAQNGSYSTYLGQMSESEAINTIHNRSEKAINSVSAALRSAISDYCDAVLQALVDSKNDFVQVFSVRKNDLSAKIKGSMQEKLDQLEADLKDKESAICEYKEAMANIESIKSILEK